MHFFLTLSTCHLVDGSDQIVDAKRTEKGARHTKSNQIRALTDWLLACKEHAVLELHRASVRQSDLNPQSQSTLLSANQGSKSSATSFMDILAGVQNESSVQNDTAQNGTDSDAETQPKSDGGSRSFDPLVSVTSRDDANTSMQEIQCNGNAASDSAGILTTSVLTNSKVGLVAESNSSAGKYGLTATFQPALILEPSSGSADVLAANQQSFTLAGTVKSAILEPRLSVKSTEKFKQRKENATDDRPGVTRTDLSGLGASDLSGTMPSGILTNARSEAAVSQSSASQSVSVTGVAKTRAGGPGSLAFAVRILGTDATDSSPVNQAKGSADPSTDPVKSSAAITSNPLVEQPSATMRNPALKIAPGPSLVGSGGSSTSAIALNASSTVISSSTVGEAHAEPQVEQTGPSLAVSEDQAAHTESVKTVQVQITGSDERRVDLKLMEKSGALTMSVRSEDGALTKALQQNLPELASKLSDQQVRAEWWRPDPLQTQATQKSGDSSGNGNNSAAQDQSGQNKGNSGQQGGRGARQPEWLDELASPRKSNQNGSQYSWHL